VFSGFFINRPIFASVLSIIVTLAGAVTLRILPVAQYPEIAPPTVEVSASYPGANAQVVADTVAAPIEQQVNGVEGMMYMSSQCTNDGTYSLTVTFQHGIDLNIAQVLVQNRVSLAQPILPDLVKRNGVAVKKKSTSVLMIINLFSPDGTRNDLYLSNYATIQLKDELSRLRGVGDITYLGRRDYSMRVWLDPDKLACRGLTVSDVTRAIEQQNTQVAAGQIGQAPVPAGQVFQLPISTMGRLLDPEQFAHIILKNDPSGRLTRLGDVSTVRLGAQSYDQTCTLDGKPSVALSVYQLPGSNALEVAGAVRDKMEDLKGRFPSGLDYAIVYDTTPFITESIHEVSKTLRDAVILVALVVLLFLQNWRTALIPLVAVPVAVVGTFVVMALLGFSLNNLTLFGLVLAIGIVVDDAIVVVEAVERQMEHGLPPKEATMAAMRLVSGPVVAVGLVLSAVFVPCAFISGITGQFYRQFALTIAVSTLLSAFNSLTLSPALSALLLRPQQKGGIVKPLPRLAFPLLGAWAGYVYLGPWLGHLLDHLPGALAENLAAAREWTGLVAGVVGGVLVGGPLNKALGWLFWGFNAGFDYSTGLYARAVGVLLRASAVVLAVYGGLVVLTWWGFMKSPTGFIPQQDKGYLLVNVQLPDSASLQRTEKVMQQIEEVARKRAGVRHTVAIGGQSLLLNANAPNFGSMFVMLNEFHERLEPDLSADAIASALQGELQQAAGEGLVNVFGAPPVEGLGTAGGFKIVVEDRGDLGADALQAVADRVVEQGNTTEGLEGLYTSFRANTPWLFLKIDRTSAKMAGVSIAEIFNTLQVDVGSLYINDFNRFGRTWQVNVQAIDKYRQKIKGLRQLRVRSDRGSMVPLGTVAHVEDKLGPVMLVRYNMYPAAIINGNAAPGVSSGQAISLMHEAAQQELDPSMGLDWTELAFLQLQTGKTAMVAFALAVVLVFLVLAAQYESWSLPLAVILVVPMCLLCSIVGVLLAKLDVNIFTQVGFIVLVGLACKNAILIVEYAKNRREAGVPRYEATLEACRLRLRPIMMTSFAFILGVVPLVLSRGAGAEMRRTLGVAVFAGMLGVTMFGIFLTPVFYYVIQWFNDWRGEKTSASTTPVPGVDGNGHPVAEDELATGVVAAVRAPIELTPPAEADTPQAAGQLQSLNP
jgi:multidrug efflux pump subunit AcrB